MDPNRPPREVKFRPKPPRKTSTLHTTKTGEASGAGTDNESQQPPTRGPSENQPEASVTGSSSKTSKDATVKKKGYQNPWENCDNPPVTYPFGRPGSGNPDVHDDDDDDDDDDDENATDAERLGLLGQDDKPRLMVFNFPPCMPQPTNASSSKETVEAVEESVKGMSLNEYPAGCIGKINVYKSGAVKLKIGDIQFDVSAGGKCEHHKNVLAVDKEGKRCLNLGDLDRVTAVVSVDVDHLLNPKTDD